jgi:hypothetical protein
MPATVVARRGKFRRGFKKIGADARTMGTICYSGGASLKEEHYR